MKTHPLIIFAVLAIASLSSHAASTQPVPMLTRTYPTLGHALARQPSPGQIMVIMGRNVVGDIPPTELYYDDTSTATTNDVNIFQPPDGVGRLIAKWNGDVRLAGATGNGTTNDSPAIMKAIAAARDQSLPIHFPPGTYYVPSRLDMLGISKITGDQAILHMDTLNELFRLQGTNIYISGITFTNSTFNDDPRGLDAGARNHLIRIIADTQRTVIENCRFYGFGMTGVWCAGANVADITVRDCYFEGNTYGIALNAQFATTGLAGDFNRLTVSGVRMENIGGDPILLNRPQSYNPEFKRWNVTVSDSILRCTRDDAWSIIDNTTIDNRGFGFDTAGAHNVILDSTIIGGRVQGIHVEDGTSSVLIDKCIVETVSDFPTGTFNNGIHVIGGTLVTIRDCVVHPQPENGIYMQKIYAPFDKISIINNKVYGSPYGLRFFLSQNPDVDNSLEIVGNSFFDQTINGIRASGTWRGVKIADNVIKTPNAVPLIVADRLIGMDLRGNTLLGIQGAGARFSTEVDENGVITNATLTNPGRGYTPTKGQVLALSVLATTSGHGSNYVSASNVPTTGGSGTGLTVNIETDGNGNVRAVTPNSPGEDYTTEDVVTIDGGDGNAQALVLATDGQLELSSPGMGASAYVRVKAVSGGNAVSVTSRVGGTGYQSGVFDTINLSGTGTGATFEVTTISDTFLPGQASQSGMSIVNAGTGYSTLSRMILNSGHLNCIIRVMTVGGSGEILTFVLSNGWGFQGTNNVNMAAIPVTGSGFGMELGVTNIISIGTFTTAPDVAVQGSGYTAGDVVTVLSSQPNYIAPYFSINSVGEGLRGIVDFDLVSGGVFHEDNTNATIANSYVPWFRREHGLVAGPILLQSQPVVVSQANTIQPQVIMELPRYLDGVLHVVMWGRTNWWAESSFLVNWDGTTLRHTTLNQTYSGGTGVTEPITIDESGVTNNVLAWTLVNGFSSARTARWDAKFDGVYSVSPHSPVPVNPPAVAGVRIHAEDTLDFGELEPREYDTLTIAAPGVTPSDYPLLLLPYINTNLDFHVEAWCLTNEVAVSVRNTGLTTNDIAPELVKVIVIKGQ